MATKTKSDPDLEIVYRLLRQEIPKNRIKIDGGYIEIYGNRGQFVTTAFIDERHLFVGCAHNHSETDWKFQNEGCDDELVFDLADPKHTKFLVMHVRYLTWTPPCGCDCKNCTDCCKKEKK
jgi:hypothetical protein